MFIQDHYSAPSDKTQHPVFALRKMTNPSENVWGHQMDQLFVFKMSEVMRVLFNTQLLLTGPEVEKGHTYSEVRVLFKSNSIFFSVSLFLFRVA